MPPTCSTPFLELLRFYCYRYYVMGAGAVITDNLNEATHFNNHLARSRRGALATHNPMAWVFPPVVASLD